MPQSVVRVPTASGSRYLQQLCKHWAHKFPVEFTPERGEITLPLGRCELQADAGGLDARLSGAEDETTLARFEQVVADHLKRFAFREDLQFAWTRG